MGKFSTRPKDYTSAVREALDLMLETDPSVIIVGEGVPDPKAIFGSTLGLQEKYGDQRVFDMPLSENGVTGVCIGAAICGMRPVMIHQRIDFALLAMDQIVNNAAKWRYIFNGLATVPIVVRMIIGRGWGQGPQHSQSLQSMFASVPGLKVVMPTTPADAKGMMIEAIEDDNPVVFVEHRWLHHIVDDVPEGIYRTPIGKAKVLHEGNKVTLVAFSYMVVEGLLAARALKKHMGISIELLDMRSLQPLDLEAITISVRKTNRMIVADTACKSGSFAGEVVSQVVENCFELLKNKPIRITSPDYPVPTSHYLAEEYYPGAVDIAKAVIDLLEVSRDTAGYDALIKDLRNKHRHDVPNRDFSGPF